MSDESRVSDAPDVTDNTEPDHQATPGLTRLAWFAVGMASLVAMFDSAVNVALPAITDSFAIQTRDIQWIITIYVLSQVCLIIVFGKLADRWGFRPVLLTGLAISAVALSLCSLASSYPALVGFRFAQGIGVGLVMACTPAVASFLMPAAKRRQAMAVYSVWLSLGLSLGPLVGGLLVHWGGWPGVFWLRVPIALLALILIWRLSFIGNPVSTGELLPNPVKPAFDRAGVAWMMLTMASLIFVLVQFRSPFFGALSVVVAAVVCAAACWQLWQCETRAADPVIQVGLFANPAFRNLQIASLFINFTTFSLLLLAPYLFVQWPGFGIIRAGLLLTLFPAGMLIAGLVATRLSTAYRSSTLITSGIFLASAGLLLCGWFGANLVLPGMAAAMILTGLGHGIFQVGHLDATLAAMPVADRGVAGSIVNLVRILGFVLGANGLLWIHDSLRGAGEAVAGDFGRSITAAGAILTIYSLVYWWQSRRARTVAP